MKNFARIMSVTLVAACAGLVIGADAPATAPAAAAAPDPGDLKITLMDGSVVSGKISVNEIAVQTPYGALRVPIDQIKSMTPGLDSHPTFDKKIADLVNDLGGDVFTAREKAQVALSRMGPAVEGELRRYLKTAEAEKQSRLQKIVEEFDAERDDAGDEAAAAAAATEMWQRDDVVVTSTFTIVGKITTPGFAVASPYGTLQLKVDDIKSAHRDAVGPEEIKKNATVRGEVFPQHDFVSTGLRLAKGDQVTIAATGTITLSPWGQAAVGPDGSQNYGQMQPGNIPCGALIGRIGPNGNAIRMGSKKTFTADKAGVLELGLASPQGDYSGQDFPGEFDVKIKVVHKGE